MKRPAPPGPTALLPGLAALFLALVLQGMVLAPVNPELSVTDLVPRFVTFYETVEDRERQMREEAAAAGEDFDWTHFSDLRHELWEEHLGEVSDLLARADDRPWEPEGFDRVWSRYGDRLDRIQRTGNGIAPDAEAVLRQVAQLLRLDRPLELQLVLYVGTFNDDPAFRLRNGEYNILLPVEQLPANFRPVLMDLYTRAVHARLSGRPADDGLSLAQHLFLRGLALRVHEEAEPGRWAHEYLLRSEEWLLAAERRDGQILNGVRNRLNERDPDRLTPYLQGGGATGLEGEFDYAAWRISGLLLMGGWTLDRLARVPEGEVGTLVAEILADG